MDSRKKKTVVTAVPCCTQ